MPLPVIAAAWAISVAAGGGAGAGGFGIKKQLDAKKKVKASKADLGTAELLTVAARDDCEEAFGDLGRMKLTVMADALIPFHESFTKLKNVDLHIAVADEGTPALDAVSIADAGRLTLSAVDAVAGIILAGGAAGAASAGASAAVASLAAASTGTAISTLSGAAASNATLAWIGGGAIASGGGGMAAGAVVMAGVAAAPAVLVGGVFLFQKGRSANARAAGFAADAETELARLRTGQTILRAAQSQAEQVRSLLQVLGMRLAVRAGWLLALVARETDWQAMTAEEHEMIREIAVLAMGTSGLVHTPIMGDEGSLTPAIRDAHDRAAALA